MLPPVRYTPLVLADAMAPISSVLMLAAAVLLTSACGSSAGATGAPASGDADTLAPGGAAASGGSEALPPRSAPPAATGAAGRESPAVMLPSSGLDVGASGAALDGGTDGSAGSPDGGSGGLGSELPAPCALPASFRWASSPPLITPKPPAGRSYASIKDPSIVFHDGKYHVFASVYETTAGAAGWRSVYLSFSDFAEANTVPQTYMPELPTGSTVAPQVFYFAPHGLWYLIFQWGARYSTNDDINDPAGWSAPRPLLAGEPAGSLDFWVICDDADCHMFFSRDDGVLYRSKTPLASFPSFSGYDVVMAEPSPGLLFEASNVYAVDGTNQYLLLVEAYGPRYFRSWTAESLDGPWRPLADTQANPFAGAANVSFDGQPWTADISHGEMLRSGHDQRMTIDACNLRYLYQGAPPGFQGDYNLIPYSLGLLELQSP